MKMRRLGSALFPMMLVVACGSDGDGGGGNVNLGVDDDKVIEDLTSAEAMKICERLQNVQLGGELTKTQTCTVGAVLLTTEASQCASFRDQCIAAPDQPGDGDDGDDADDCSQDDPAEREGCKATVGEFEACLEASADRFESLKDLSCDDAGQVTQGELTATPEACEALNEKCPNLLEDDSAPGADGSADGSLRKLLHAQTF